jgi:hypothetical protein
VTSHGIVIASVAMDLLSVALEFGVGSHDNRSLVALGTTILK